MECGGRAPTKLKTRLLTLCWHRLKTALHVTAFISSNSKPNPTAHPQKQKRPPISQEALMFDLQKCRPVDPDEIQDASSRH
jgi:hypothetical protein